MQQRASKYIQCGSPWGIHGLEMRSNKAILTYIWHASEDHDIEGQTITHRQSES